MKIIDRYILKRFLLTFAFTLLILLPITVAVDFAEKTNKFLDNKALTSHEIIYDYYVNFVVYFGNTFMPLALFLAVIIFTSRMANNTEIIAINDAQVSFTRMLFPYFIGATLVTVFALTMNHYIVPISNKTKNAFETKYLSKKGKKNYIDDFSLQLDDNVYIHFRDFNLETNEGTRFSIDTYDGLKLKSKFMVERIIWNPEKKTFTLKDWTNRIVGKEDKITYGKTKDTTFVFSPKDFDYENITAFEMNTPTLKKFIDVSKKRGVKNLNPYLVELYKRTSLPIATFFLTMIAVGVSYKKKRGGMGFNLAVGIALMFTYVFCLKVSEVLGAVPEVNPFIYVWTPNVLFGLVAIFLFFNARGKA